MIKIGVWTCDITSRSYFGKMNSTLGSVVPLAMFFLNSDSRNPRISIEKSARATEGVDEHQPCLGHSFWWESHSGGHRHHQSSSSSLWTIGVKTSDILDIWSEEYTKVMFFFISTNKFLYTNHKFFLRLTIFQTVKKHWNDEMTYWR